MLNAIEKECSDIPAEVIESSEGFFETLLYFCGQRTVALLQAYFDESERGNGLLCVAGYGFSTAQALKLTKEFRGAFSEYGGFHMKDLVHKKEGFSGISEEERERLIKEAVRIVRNRFSYGVAVTVNIEEYRRQAPRFIRGFGNAYPFLCHLAMIGMAEIARKHNDKSPISYVFEAGHAHESEARHAVRQMTLSPELMERCNYHSDSFLPKSDAVPLQAADLLAWEAAKFQDESVDKKLRRPRLSLLTLIAPPNMQRYSFHFCRGASLTRTLNKYRQLGMEQIMENRNAAIERKLKRDGTRNLRPSNEENSVGIKARTTAANGRGEED